jgi:hypothetical protein
VLAELHAALQRVLPGHARLVPQRDDGDRRRGERVQVHVPAKIRSNELTIYGDILDVGAGGVFLSTGVLIEEGERGLLTIEPAPGERPRPTEGVEIIVVWSRPYTHPLGAGLGLKFEMSDKPSERRALEMLLSLLSG